MLAEVKLWAFCANKTCMPNGQSRKQFQARPSRSGLLEGSIFHRCERCGALNLVEFESGQMKVMVLEYRSP